MQRDLVVLGMGQADHITRNGLNHWAGKEGGVKVNKDPQKKSSSEISLERVQGQN